MLDWLRLARVPNHATAVADVLAGFVICSPGLAFGPPPVACWAAIGASVCFYAAGMVLNDVYDVASDRRERPERPLPRGAIGLGAAAAVGGGLLSLGAVAACGTAILSGSPWPAFVGALLTGSIWLYDRHAKRTGVGPVVMGLCRGLNWLLGMTAAAGPHAAWQLLLPVGMAVYVAGLTLYARDEAGGGSPAVLLVAVAVMLAGLGVAAAPVGIDVLAHRRLAVTAFPPATWLLLWTVLAGSILARCLLGVLDPSAGNIRRAVGNAIMSIITLDAALVLAFAGERFGLAVLVLVAPFMLGRRLVPPT